MHPSIGRIAWNRYGSRSGNGPAAARRTLERVIFGEPQNRLLGWLVGGSHKDIDLDIGK